MQAAAGTPAASSGASAFFNNARTRSVVYQVLTLVLVAAVFWWLASNTVENLARSNIASGFGFLRGRAGFDISQSLISFTSNDTYARALLVGLLNTILVALSAIVASTILGFMIGMGRLSRNWPVAKFCTVYIEIFRNVPALLVIFFGYAAFLAILPTVRESMALPLGAFLNNRGLAFPTPLPQDGFWLVPAAAGLALLAALFLARWARRRQGATGRTFPTGRVSAALLIGAPVAAFFLAGSPVDFEFPVLGKFNVNGGSVVGPEFIALFLALSAYNAAFIAEIVRAGIRGVPHGQTEAALALGLHQSAISRLVVLPQALRIIIPPLSSQYLNLTKASSLALAIGFADFVAVGSTTLNQTGQAVEVIFIWMAVYLTLSIVTSLFMNWFNAKMALVGH